MSRSSVVTAADLFCGGGGTSTGLALACRAIRAKIKLVAINHWTVAIETHKANHPWATHYCESVERINPREIVPSGRLKILVASPECTHFARARGARPMNEQSRATAWHVLKFCQELYVENLLLENVQELLDWGPLGADGRPLRSKRGETFRAFITALESLDYRVEYRVLNAADYGDATSRKRLFILARRPGHRRIRWPEPTHAQDTTDLFRDDLKPWRPAREIIDWSIPGESIFGRKKPLKKSTLERIAAGLTKYCALPEPFLVILRRHMAGQSLDAPLPAICANGTHVALCQPEPFVLQQQSGGSPRSTRKPLPTIAGRGAQALIQPFLIPFYTEGGKQKPRTHDVGAPLPSVPATGNGKFAVVDPRVFFKDPEAFLVSACHGEGDGRRAHSLKAPLKTVTGSKEYGLVQPRAFLVGPDGAAPNGRAVGPVIVNMKGRSKASSIDKPLPTQCTRKHLYVAEPFFFSMEHGANGAPRGGGKKGRNGRVYPSSGPMPTITSADAWGVVEPYLVKYNRTGKAHSVKDPLHAVTAKDRFGLVQPGVTRIGIDIRFRMLRPHELAAAMGFPKDYRFVGTREQQVKQVGNAVAVNMAKALCMAMLKD